MVANRRPALDRGRTCFARDGCSDSTPAKRIRIKVDDLRGQRPVFLGNIVGDNSRRNDALKVLKPRRKVGDIHHYIPS